MAFQIYNIMERLLSGVSGAMVPGRAICQFSGSPAISIDNESKLSFTVGYLNTGIRVYSKSSLCLLYNESLKNLPAAGARDGGTGAVTNQGTNGFYWSSTATVSGTSPASYLNFNSASPTVPATGMRAVGCPVRCVQESAGLLRLYRYSQHNKI